MVSDETNVTRIQRAKMKLVSLASYLLPLLASIPPMMGWAGLMTVPLIFFLLVMGGRFPELPVSLPYLFLGGSILDALVIIFGFILFVVSVIILWRGKSQGLVTHNVYRLARHPQYLGLILFTAGLTSRSVWILMHTLGVGWLSINNTILIWVMMVVAYTVLALIEELHLSSVFADSWSDYRKKVGFIIPVPVKLPRMVEVILAIVIPVLLLYGLIFFSL
jgi:protein-S-isoprenylcysteine O-methyltransferase Ste14